MVLTISHPPPTIQRPPSVNNICGGSECYTTMNCIVLFRNRVIHTQSLLSVFVYNFTNMHAMSYRSDFFACSCKVNIYKPAVYYIVRLLLAVFGVESSSFLILSAMSDSKSLNTSLLKVMISSKNKHGFMYKLSNLTLQIIFDAWWASMNVGSKRPIAWNTSRHAPSWRF